MQTQINFIAWRWADIATTAVACFVVCSAQQAVLAQSQMDPEDAAVVKKEEEWKLAEKASRWIPKDAEVAVSVHADSHMFLDAKDDPTLREGGPLKLIERVVALQALVASGILADDSQDSKECLKSLVDQGANRWVFGLGNYKKTWTKDKKRSFFQCEGVLFLAMTKETEMVAALQATRIDGKKLETIQDEKNPKLLEIRGRDSQTLFWFGQANTRIGILGKSRDNVLAALARSAEPNSESPVKKWLAGTDLDFDSDFWAIRSEKFRLPAVEPEEGISNLPSCVFFATKKSDAIAAVYRLRDKAEFEKRLRIEFKDGGIVPAENAQAAWIFMGNVRIEPRMVAPAGIRVTFPFDDEGSTALMNISLNLGSPFGGGR